MDIIITKDSFRTLVDVVITNLTHIDLVQHASTTTMHGATVAAQDKARSYIERAPGMISFPLP